MRFILAVAVITVFSQGALAAKRVKNVLPKLDSKNIEVWCGSPKAQNKYDFPYLAAIRTYSTKPKGKKPGHRYQVAIVYKFGRPVMKNYVRKTHNGDSISFISADDEFALKLNTEGNVSDFRAVVRDRDGATLVANGQFPCHKKS